MDAVEIDRLVADLHAMTSRMNQLLKTDPSLTALQKDCLVNAIGNLNTFLVIYRTPLAPLPDSLLK